MSQLDLFTGYRCGPYDCESSDRGFCLWCHFPCRPRAVLQREKRLAEAARETVRRLWEQGVRGIGALCDASALSVPAVWGVLRGMGVEDMPWWDEGEQWPDATEAA